MSCKETLINVLEAILMGGIGFAIMLFGAWLVKRALEYPGIRKICLS